ncbi:MAG: helix-turn-helix domain-containing protein, partial [Robiginitomaculum sp.]|nr:helix-turn-helix domain-containing protein [Robiginitomaculum sp.]
MLRCYCDGIYIYGQLSQNERLEIYHFNRQGLSIRAIGRRLYR